MIFSNYTASKLTNESKSIYMIDATYLHGVPILKEPRLCILSYHAVHC